jgi:hypothetical protein
MTLNLLVGGMPRGATTVAAKFMSLHPDTFCYAGDTHLIPLLHGMFGYLPCLPDKVEWVSQYLRQQFMTAMVDMPRFSVSQGAHPGNLIFDDHSVDDIVDAIQCHLKSGIFGIDLYKECLATLNEVLSKVDHRPIRGEKTPSNIFAMADYGEVNPTRYIVVMREPFGVLRSMRARVKSGDSYSAVFKGNLETNIGMYLEYASAAKRAMHAAEAALLVRYEDMALRPAVVVQDMFESIGGKPEERVIRFVEKGGDHEIASRAPMNYRRLSIPNGAGDFSPPDIWTIYSLTRPVRDAFGYSENEMKDLGLAIPGEWPGIEVPPKVLPLYGFHQAKSTRKPWMKRRGGLVVYLPKGKSHGVILGFKSEFPNNIKKMVELRLSVNGVEREVLTVESGSRTIEVPLTIHRDDLVPMGNKGGYAMIDLVSSLSYCRIGHVVGSIDAQEISFKLSHWKVEKRRPRWWPH